MKNNKHAKEGELNMVKVIGAIIIVVAIISAIVFFVTRKNDQNVSENNTIENYEENAVAEATIIPNEEQVDAIVGPIVQPSEDDPIVNPEDSRSNNENKAVELVQKYRGEDDSVYYSIDSENGDVYNIAARDKETTAAVMFYEVNVSTGEVKEQ